MMLKNRALRMWQSYDIAIWIRAFGTALTSLTNFMMRPFLVLYLYNQLDGSILLSTLVVSLSPLVGMLVNLIAGGLSDRIGRKPVMAAALLIQLASMLGLIAAASVWHYAIMSILNGIGHSLFGPAANAQVSDVVPEEKRPEVFALFHTALNLGAALGPLLGLALFSWNMHVVFLVCAVSIGIYAAVLWWKVPETLDPAQQERARTRSRSPNSRIRLREHTAILWISLAALPVGLLYAQVESTLPLHLETRFDNYQTVFATMMAFNGLMVIALQMWIARKSKDMPLHWVMGISYTLFATVSIGYGFAPWFILLLAVEFAFTIGEMLNGPHLQKLVSVLAPPEHRGFYFSIYGMNWQISRGLGPVLGGIILSHLNGQYLFSLMSAILLVAGVSMVRLARKISQPRAVASPVEAEATLSA
ncbi:MAG: transporter [Paenibacillaceae bacterium]|jgi:MFS family permease|nr:transporter [Paenibacillaceae bacterium]